MGSSCTFWMMASINKRRWAASSTFCGRWSVSTTYCPACNPIASNTAGLRKRDRLASSVSIITLPTKWIFCSLMPKFLRFWLATSLVVKNQSVNVSVTILLISSGIVRSQLRMPASTCATCVCSFLATIAQAIVEVTSPTTITKSAGCAISSFSNAIMICAVSSACVPPPQPKLISGAGIANSSKNVSDMFLS